MADAALAAGGCVRAIVLLAHGSRDPQWSEPFEHLREAVMQRCGDAAVALAYLDHSPPDFASVAGDLIARGATQIDIVPLFLGAGTHVRNDVPKLVDLAASRHSSVRFQLRPFIGDAPTVLAAIADYAAAEA